MRRDELLNWMPSIEAEFDRRGLDTYAMAVSKATEIIRRDGETIAALEAERDRLKSWIDTLQEEINVRAQDTADLGKAIGASKRLIASLESQLSHHRAKAKDYAEAVLQIDSERAANEQLQAELDAMTAERDAFQSDFETAERLLASTIAERDELLATPADKREDLRCVIADISAQCAALWAERDQLRAELAEANDYINRLRDMLTDAHPCIDPSRDACGCILCELVSRERQQAALAAKEE